MIVELIGSIIAVAAIVICVRFFRNRRFEKTVTVFLFAGYFATLIYFTAIRGTRTGVSDVSLRLFPVIKAIVNCNYGLTANRSVLNFLLLVPFGFLLPHTIHLLWGKDVKWWVAVLSGFLLSLLTELSQYFFRFGVLELDDIIKNTLGAFCGVLLWTVFCKTVSAAFVKSKDNTMLTSEQKTVLFLLQKSLGICAKDTLSEERKEFKNAILHNGLLLTVYPALPEVDQKTLKSMYSAALKQSILQLYEGERVLNALNKMGIESIALKGWELKKLYPNPNMRQMADIDILVRPYDYKRIKAVMEELGFRGEGASPWKHDSFKKGEVHVEMHKRLTDDSGEIQKWEREMWSKAVRVRGNIFKMSPEDFYIFHFIHLHKDFMNGSLGLRRIADTWLLQKQPMNKDSVKTELTRFGLLAFHDKMVKVSRAVMGETPMDKDCEILLSHAFKYGIYGSDISYKAGRITAMGKNLKSGKIHSVFSAVFLPVGRMKAQYPILEKWPILLPWCWMKRIAYFAFNDPKGHYKRLDYGNIGEADYQEMERFFEAGGITRK